MIYCLSLRVVHCWLLTIFLPFQLSGLTCDLVGCLQENGTDFDVEFYDSNSDTPSLAGYKYLAEREIMEKSSLIDTDMYVCRNNSHVLV